jgi:GTP-binding protein HflX
MGLGSYEADVYHDAIGRQVYTIQKKLAKIREKRLLHRERRLELGFNGISLAGYTSAGKTSLFNALTQETKLVGNKTLFTTLSTTTRMIEFQRRQFLLTDTVGFIDRLPLSLMDAFHSTLEETIYSDLIILVLDLSEPQQTVEKKNKICLETIERIGAAGIPLITALNKIDLLSEEEATQKLAALGETVRNPVLISALHCSNLETLKREILKNFENLVQATFTIPMTKENMHFLSWVYDKANVKKTTYQNNAVEIMFESNPDIAEGIRNRVERLKGKFDLTPAVASVQQG